ncbi:MAG: hypothetical protein K8I27_06770 [Planctomycetes bacterium]|nr:hypothetical protein [Planctomycetota bacterium]
MVERILELGDSRTPEQLESLLAVVLERVFAALNLGGQIDRVPTEAGRLIELLDPCWSGR